MKNLFLFLLIIAFTQANAMLHLIEVEDNQFNPANITVNVGDSIRWSRDIGNVNPHTVTSALIPDSADTFDAPIDMQNPTFTYVVELPGTYDYICSFHTGMTGRITVIGPSSLQHVSQTYLKVVNPVRGNQLMFFYELKKPGGIDIILTDMQGAKVIDISTGMRNAGPHQEEYNLPMLPKGVYLLQVKNADRVVAREVIM